MEGGKCSVCCSLRASENLVLHPCLGEFPDYALLIPFMHSLVSTAMDTGFIRHKSQATHFAMTVSYCLSAIFLAAYQRCAPTVTTKIRPEHDCLA